MTFELSKRAERKFMAQHRVPKRVCWAIEKRFRSSCWKFAEAWNSKRLAEVRAAQSTRILGKIGFEFRVVRYSPAPRKKKSSR